MAAECFLMAGTRTELPSDKMAAEADLAPKNNLSAGNSFLSATSRSWAISEAEIMSW